MKLPKESLLNGHEEKIEQFLSSHQKLLWQGSSMRVPTVPLTDSLLKALLLARRTHQLRAGLENIEAFLAREANGLQSASHTIGISRLLIMSNDGSDRFYRNCENLLQEFGERMLGCSLNASAQELGTHFFGKETQVKAMLICHKSFVARALIAMSVDVEKI